MAKTSKKNRRNLCQMVALRKNASSKKPNPFELKINRQKHEVLGRKVKHNQGLPGVARSKMMVKRQETLLLEYKQRNKANKFTDKRLGEYDADVTPEEKMLARFAAERKANHSKVDIFNLNDEEELTHFGQSLADIDKFDDPRSDSEEDDNNLVAEFVKNAHFGGFLTKKQYDGDDVDDKDGTKSRKELIDDLIAKSKLRKHEKQQERETTLDLTEKLDADWKNLRSLLPPVKKSKAEAAKLQLDDYDLMVRELKFEQRGKALDRLKTPDEIAREEKENLEKLEIERLRRMKGDDDEVFSSSRTVKKHYSADDLNDGFQLTKDNKKFWVSYKNGQLENTPSSKTQSVDDDGENTEKTDNNGKAQESQDEDSDDDESDEEAIDIVESEDETESENIEHKASTLKSSTAEAVRKHNAEADIVADLPFVYSVPLLYEEFLNLIEGHSVTNQLIIIDRIIKCHHPCLAEGNREKLEAFFPMLLQLMNDVVSQDKPAFELVDRLAPQLYTILHLSPVNCAQCILEVILEKHGNFHKACSVRASNTTALPSFDTIIFLKLVPKLFPTSDFQHPVVTPTMLFMGQILMQGKITHSRDVAAGLLVCSLFREYVSMSKRFVPEAIAFLIGVFYSALKKDSLKYSIAIPAFKRNSAAAHILELQENCSNLVLEGESLRLSMEYNGEFTDLFRLKVLNACFILLYKFAVLYETLPSYVEIFSFFTKNHTCLPTERFPPEIKKNLDSFLSQVNKGFRCKRTALVQKQKKPQPLKLLEPRIEDQFDGRKPRKGSKGSLEKQKLLHHYKRELKGAVREIRRDNQFLAKQRLDDQLERDAERKRKLKELYHDLATQEGNCKALERIKKKK